MTLASVVLLTFVWGLFAYDAVSLRGSGRRMLALEGILFAAGSLFIAAPDLSTTLANRVGIGRGADLVLYTVTVWLVRESLAHRRHRLEDADRMTRVVRAIALLEAKDTARPRTPHPQGEQLPSSSPSTTT